MKVLFIIPPMTQVNTPYPATTYLTAFLRELDHEAHQRDLGLDLFHQIFSVDGLKKVRAHILQKNEISDLEAFFIEAYDDYESTSGEIASDRSMAKTVNFGLMYGQSSFGLASTLKISRTEAKVYIEKYFNRFSSIKTFLDTLKDKAEQTGFTETLFGRKRLLPDIHSQNRTIKCKNH